MIEAFALQFVAALYALTDAAGTYIAVNGLVPNVFDSNDGGVVA